MQHLRRLIAFVLALMWASVAAPVAADCEPAGPIEEELLAAPVAFVGTVTEVVGGSARFNVLEVWAGDVGEEAHVVGGGWFAARGGQQARRQIVEDDRSWELGETYLVLPVPHQGLLADNACTATTVWESDLEAFRPADVVGNEPGQADEASAVPYAPVAVSAVAVVLLGLSALALRRR
jgi:hypothetical protein